MLQIIVKEKEEADAKHEELFDNDYVPSAELNAMHKAWLTVFGTANTAKYNVLVTAINNVINSETKEEIEKNMETYRTAYSEYGSAVTEYQTAVSIAIEAAQMPMRRESKQCGRNRHKGNERQKLKAQHQKLHCYAKLLKSITCTIM